MGENVRPVSPTLTTWTVFPDAEVATVAAADEVMDEDMELSELPYCAKATGSAASTTGSVEKSMLRLELNLRWFEVNVV